MSGLEPLNPESAAHIFRGPFACGTVDRQRLTKQIQRVGDFAMRTEWFTIGEMREALERIYPPTRFPETSLSSQCRNLKKVGWTYEKRLRGGALWEFRLRPPAPAETSLVT